VTLPLVALARTRTALDGDQLRHAQRLVASWQTLADLSFSDLLLLSPVEPASEPSGDGAEGARFVVLAHVRPTTGQTLYPSDPVGVVVSEVDRPLVARAWREGALTTGDGVSLEGHEPARLQCIPLRHRGELVGVVVRETPISSGRRHGDLERFYLEVFDAFAHMLAEGSFPFDNDDTETEETPRVGDGVIVLDAERRVRFASPNAVSAFHRIGIHAYAQGLQLAEVGFDQAAIDAAYDRLAPVISEIERGNISLLLHAVPLLARGRVTGAILILRDVTDLRHRDRMLLTKDATIREIHHRVKNNLQTIAALLRLQGRRSESSEARAAIAESERRIRAIAIVHETLSRETGELVPFDDIVRPLVRLVEETVSSEDRAVRIRIEGHVGQVRGELATPLAVVLTELMQNAADHAFPVGAFSGGASPGAIGERREGHVVVRTGRDEGDVLLEVEDDGLGLPPGFSLEDSLGLGLSIVHTLVTSELGGQLELRGGPGGTRVSVRVPVSGG
jgi:two-component sensor histidine kinase